MHQGRVHVGKCLATPLHPVVGGARVEAERLHDGDALGVAQQPGVDDVANLVAEMNEPPWRRDAGGRHSYDGKGQLIERAAQEWRVDVAPQGTRHEAVREHFRRERRLDVGQRRRPRLGAIFGHERGKGFAMAAPHHLVGTRQHRAECGVVALIESLAKEVPQPAEPREATVVHASLLGE